MTTRTVIDGYNNEIKTVILYRYPSNNKHVVIFRNIDYEIYFTNTSLL